MDLRLCYPNNWKTQRENGCPLGESKDWGPPPDHSSSHARTTETESRWSPDDPPGGHHTIWGGRGAAGPGPKPRLAVTGQDTGVPAAGRRGPRSERRHSRPQDPGVDSGEARYHHSWFGSIPANASFPPAPTPHPGNPHSPFLGFLGLSESFLRLPRPPQVTARQTLRHCHHRH